MGDNITVTLGSETHIDFVPVTLKHPKRLLALADLIETVSPFLFTMRQYREVTKNRLEDCGTVGCILGHSPRLIIQKRWASIKSILDSNGQIDWETVSKVFGVDPISSLWDYLFGMEWVNGDNTPTGAAARIRWVVKHKGIPFTARAERSGCHPLSYVEKPNE